MATKLQANWTAVGWNSVVFTKVDGLSFDYGGSLEEYSGDLDRFPTVLTNLMSRPTAKLDCSDVGAMMLLTVGVASTLAATHKDAKIVSGGDVVYAMANAVLANVSAQGDHAKYGSASASFQAFSSDGTTNPLTLTYTGG